ncbi:hypothetical protein FBU30_004996 [Linnemannia zychae]|nr:hypothetical protein FBU30_004996 [Linnemannia zychae]
MMQPMLLGADILTGMAFLPMTERGQVNRLGRALVEYSDNGYHGHPQDSSLAAQQQQQQQQQAGTASGGGMVGASMDGLPLMSPHPLHTAPQSQSPFSPLSLLNTATAGNAAAAYAAAAQKSLSAPLDPVPMGLGPSSMASIVSHPSYDAVAHVSSPTTTPINKNSATIAGTAMRPIPLPRSQSAYNESNQIKLPKKRRTRTSSMTSSSSIASNGIMNSITSTLGSTNISFTDSPSGSHPQSQYQHQHQNQHHHHNNNLPGLSIIGGSNDGMEFSNGPTDGSPNSIALTGLSIVTGSTSGSPTTTSPTSGKLRTGGHPRSAIAARVFECSFPGCNKAYTQLHNLKSHERTGHTPVQKPRPFLCIIPGCTKAFSQRKSLALHIRASHKEYKFKPFKCSQQGCDKSYTQLHNLRTHEKTVHMLDLSRKRIRNPIPYTGPGSNIGVGVGGMVSGPTGPSSVASSISDRDHFSADVGLSYESIDDLKDFNSRRNEGGYRRHSESGGGGSGDDEEEEADQYGLSSLKEDDNDGDYVG